jgi:hypothetical protein
MNPDRRGVSVEKYRLQGELNMALARMPNAFQAYPTVHAFVYHHVRMQFEDVGAMLRLPLQAQGVTNGCNFAAASVICNLLSGISVTIFQPAVTRRPVRHGRMQIIGSGEAVREFVQAYYPEAAAARRAEVAGVLYRQLRNPFAHALGVLTPGAPRLDISRLSSPNAATPGDGITAAELTAIEESPQRPGNIPAGVQGADPNWQIIVDLLYRDALDMMVALAQDAHQMNQAEARFQAGTLAWRI